MTQYKMTALFIALLSASLSGRTTVLFSPDDKPAKQLISLIEKAQKNILVAVYTITHKNITTALLNAHERGVTLEIVTDKTTLDNRGSKIELLSQHNIPVYIYNDAKNQKSYNSIMHHKYAIFDAKTVWTGSFNWTQSAANKNQENVIITHDKAVINRYTKQFEKLKTRCLRSKKAAQVSQPEPPPKTVSYGLFGALHHSIAGLLYDLTTLS